MAHRAELQSVDVVGWQGGPATQAAARGTLEDRCCSYARPYKRDCQGREVMRVNIGVFFNVRLGDVNGARFSRIQSVLAGIFVSQLNRRGIPGGSNV